MSSRSRPTRRPDPAAEHSEGTGRPLHRSGAGTSAITASAASATTSPTRNASTTRRSAPTSKNQLEQGALGRAVGGDQACAAGGHGEGQVVEDGGVAASGERQVRADDGGVKHGSDLERAGCEDRRRLARRGKFRVTQLRPDWPGCRQVRPRSPQSSRTHSDAASAGRLALVDFLGFSDLVIPAVL